MKYERITPPLSVNLSCAALAEAAVCVGPAFQYELYVSTVESLYARGLLRRIAAESVENPFAPHVNLRIDEKLKPREWFLAANGLAFGSEGL